MHRVQSALGSSGPGEPGLGWLMNIGGEPVGMTHDSRLPQDLPGALIRPSGDVPFVPLVGLGLRVTLSVAPIPENTIGVVFRRAVFRGAIFVSDLEPRGRPRFARFGLDGRLRGEVVNATLETLPPELADTLHISSEEVGGHLHFVRQDALRQTVGSSVHIGRALRRYEPHPPIAFSGTHFVVAHLEHVEREWVVQTTAIRCEPWEAEAAHP